MRVRVLLFAEARATAGADAIDVDLPAGATVADLAARLTVAHPHLASIVPSSRIAVNAEFAERVTVVNETDEVALIPPVSGG